jgi:hypothetical protein
MFFRGKAVVLMQNSVAGDGGRMTNVCFEMT